MTDLNPVDDSIFEAAVHKVAPRPWDRYTKIIEGVQARAMLAERERDEMADELAKMKQRKAIAEGMIVGRRDFWLGLICGGILTFLGTMAGALSFFVNLGWIQ